MGMVLEMFRVAVSDYIGKHPLEGTIWNQLGTNYTTGLLIPSN